MKTLLLISSLFAISAITPSKGISKEYATLSSEGNSFSLLTNTYTEEENFVYSSHIDFVSGQATGLVFGAVQNENYFVFNIDRYENKTKLLHFYLNDENSLVADELYSDYYIGNDKVTQSELNVINPRVRDYPSYDFKIVKSSYETNQYFEFYIDNIKRFGIDTEILASEIGYTGGNIGQYVFNANVKIYDTYIDEVDSIYYSDTYRNQYHYSQFAHWNNDPNGMVYYNGYYHLYYQTNPYDKQWGDMYWGHARSTDLIHWEELPIALFPDDSSNALGAAGTGYAWSGCAMVYHKGMSSVIDNANWFSGESGLLGYYTRDGWESQDQVIITSDDEGLTWTKRALIPQSLLLSGGKKDCRDPGIFPVKKDANNVVTKWGMTLSSQGNNKVFMLQSDDLVNWSYAGEFNTAVPECVSISKVKDTNNVERTLMVIMSRGYLVGEFVYDDATSKIKFINKDGVDISTLSNVVLNQVECGEDSYAAQTFYIDDQNSEYYGKSVAMSWYSGLPAAAEAGLYAGVRSTWNGGGFTIPVIFGLDENLGLTQTPITKDNAKLEKTNIVNVVNENVNEKLDINVNNHTYELIAHIDNPNKENISFVVNENKYEKTTFGWTKEEGYFFDRSLTSAASIKFDKTYHSRYKTGIVDKTSLDFYVLVDNGGIEMFVDNFRYAFYNLTLSSKDAIKAYLTTTGDITVTSLQVNEITSIWKHVSPTVGDCLVSDLDFDNNSVIGGSWEVNKDKIVGIQRSGDGFIASTTTATDFSLSMNVDVSEAVAAGVLFRATNNLDNYVIANFDKNANISKMWTKQGELANKAISGADYKNININLNVEGNDIVLFVNGVLVSNVTLDTYMLDEGYFGLNVCGGTATFKNIYLLKTKYTFNNADLTIISNGDVVDSIVNVTNKNTIIQKGFYTVEDRKIVISESYFALLDENKDYTLLINARTSSFEIVVKVGQINKMYAFDDISTIEGEDVSIYIGTLTIDNVSINGVTLTDDQYYVKDYTLHIKSGALTVGNNNVSINNEYSFNINVIGEAKPVENNQTGLIVLISVPSGLVLLGAVTLITILVINKKKGAVHENNN